MVIAAGRTTGDARSPIGRWRYLRRPCRSAAWTASAARRTWG